MCGICGFYKTNSNAGIIDAKYLEDMNSQMILRGPDGGNIWMQDDNICGLGHRRLSIIDLSPTESYQGQIDPELSNDFIDYVNDSILNRRVFSLNPEMGETIRFNNGKHSYEIVLGLDNDIYIDRKVRDTDEIADMIRYQLKANQKENILEKINELIQVIE